MKKNILALLLLIVTFSACKKDSGSSQTPPSTNLLNANTYIVDSLTIASVTDTTVTLSSSAANAQVGNVVLGAPTAKAPYGFLRKIVMVKQVGGNVVCSTVQASLNEAFKQLNINTISKATLNKTALFGSPADSGASYKLKFNKNSTIAKGVTYDGEIDCNVPSIKFEYIKQDGSTDPQMASIQADINTKGSSLTMTYTLANNLQLASEYTLGTYNLPPLSFTIPITTPLGIIPFPMKFTQKIIFTTLPLNFSGKASLTVHPEISATVGAKYENGVWSNLSTFSIEANADSLAKSSFDLSATLNANATVIKPRYEISPFGIDALKGFFEVPASLDLTVQKQSPNYSMKFNLDVTGGIDQKIFTGLDQTYSITGNAINKTILEGDFPKTLSIGDTAYGGTVFYIDKTGNHGLVSGPVFQNSSNNGVALAEWEAGCFNASTGVYNPTPTGATDTAIGTGAKNTTKIIAVLGNKAVAALLCRNYRGGGYSDWFMPSIGELNELNKVFNFYCVTNNYNPTISLKFIQYNGNFYSSSECVQNGLSVVWCEVIQSGVNIATRDKNGYPVFPVRAF